MDHWKATLSSLYNDVSERVNLAASDSKKVFNSVEVQCDPCRDLGIRTIIKTPEVRWVCSMVHAFIPIYHHIQC